MTTVIVCTDLFILIQVVILLFFKGGTTFRNESENDESK